MKTRIAALGVLLVGGMMAAGCRSLEPSTMENRTRTYQEEFARAPRADLLYDAISIAMQVRGYRIQSAGMSSAYTDWQVWEARSSGSSAEVRERFQIKVSSRGRNLYVARIRHEVEMRGDKNQWHTVEVPASLFQAYRDMRQDVRVFLRPYMHQEIAAG